MHTFLTCRLYESKNVSLPLNHLIIQMQNFMENILTIITWSSLLLSEELEATLGPYQACNNTIIEETLKEMFMLPTFLIITLVTIQSYYVEGQEVLNEPNTTTGCRGCLLKETIFTQYCIKMFNQTSLHAHVFLHVDYTSQKT